MAIEKGNNVAMYNLALHYEKIKDYEQMKKYYLMAIEKEDSDAMYNLANYYKKIKDYEQMEKYYLMAIEKGNNVASERLISYYEKNKEYNAMIEVCLISNNNKKIEEYLMENIDIDNYTKINKILFSKELIDKYNNIFINSRKKRIIIDRNYDKMECINCIQLTECLFKHCGHYFCDNCYNNNCRLCYHDNKKCSYDKCSLCN